MKKLNRTIIVIVSSLLILSIGLNMFLGYKTYLGSQIEVGEKEKITIEVIVDAPSQQKEYYSYTLLGTEVEYLEQAMKEADFEYEATKDGFVNSINGFTAVWDESQGRLEYWAVYINGEYASEGIGTQVIKDGDIVTFEFTVTEPLG